MAWQAACTVARMEGASFEPIIRLGKTHISRLEAEHMAVLGQNYYFSARTELCASQSAEVAANSAGGGADPTAQALMAHSTRRHHVRRSD